MAKRKQTSCLLRQSDLRSGANLRGTCSTEPLKMVVLGTPWRMAWLTWALAGVGAVVAASPPVQVQLRTPWAAPPLLYEILEAAHTEDKDAFFPLVTHLLAPTSALWHGNQTDKDVYTSAVDIMDEYGLLNEAGARSNWETSLALHAESAKVSAFWQMYDTAGLADRVQSGHQQCRGSWVDFAGETLCSAHDVESALHKNGQRSSTGRPYPEVTPLDHVYKKQSAGALERNAVILYADPYAQETWALHSLLVKLASDELVYILRWKPSLRRGDPTLSGYGAALDLKKVDYLVIDDRKLDDTAAARHGDTPSAQAIAPQDQQARDDRAWMNKLLSVKAGDDSLDMSDLSPEELSDIAIKATQVIMKSRNPLRALRQLSQDFPAHVVALARHASKPSKALVQQVHLLQARTDAGGYDVVLNGKSISSGEAEQHPFGLIDALRSERDIVNALVGLGIQPLDAVQAITSRNITDAYTKNDANPPAFDASDRIERGDGGDDMGAITYWNDLEAEGDPRYARWPRDLKSLLRPMYPGSFPFIRLNLFNVILALDLENLSAIQFISDTVQLASGKISLRWGIVPINIDDEQSASTKMTRYFWLVNDRLGPSTTAKYLRRVALACKGLKKVDLDIAALELDKILEITPQERDSVLAEASKDRFIAARLWAKRLRATPDGEGHVFLNGLHVPFHSALIQSLNQLVMIQLQSLVEPIYFGKIDADETNISTYFYDLPTTYRSRSALLFPDQGNRIKTRAFSLSAQLHHADQLLLPATQEHETPVAAWLIGNFDTPQGAHLASQVLEASKSVKAQLGFVHSETTSAQDDHLSRQLQCALGTKEDIEQDVIHRCIINQAHCTLKCGPKELEKVVNASSILHRNLGLSQDSFGILVNGRLMYDFDPDQLSADDYTALLSEEENKANVVSKIIEARTTRQTIVASSIIFNAFFVPPDQEGIFTTPSTRRVEAFEMMANKETTFTIGDRQSAKLHFDVLIDPVSMQVQKWSGIIQMLSLLEDAFIRVTLNPSANVTSLPIKRFYRYSAPDKLTFNIDGSVKGTTLSFLDMPENAVLTMGLDAPPTWLTMPEEAIYDLDNIRLRDAVTPSVSAIYELKNVLIEGHARDIASRSVPRGLQLVLETLDGSIQLDTIVMANLAYFQFHAAPGLYRLRIREGRSADLYDMYSVGNLGWESPPINETGDFITLGNIQGLTIYPRVAKKADRLYERLVEDGEEQAEVEDVDSAAQRRSGGLLDKAQRVLGSWKTAQVTETSKVSKNSHAEINVFTVASGHLYERMTYIMVLSVLKHTSHSVKFWFIENFLSPSFKSFIPLLAQEYNFTYELVTYAWPHWLRHQSEKQRSIWGMKVLFLDVLFPLDLNKVIFVDADQIVRADLIELINTDLQGAPYGLPPMGNDSFDMDNFRFWESGYWEKFLQGKPYPISALFVVDLNRFRLVAAGDKLRGHYQALSADPGSLSNLDQDLVASMIHTVPIHSLDKDWLWCETWCSWDWYDRAKSIDLCSNPKTHEPKLDRARRQIPEWTIYDDEVAAIARRFEEQGRLGANVVAANVDAVGAGDPPKDPQQAKQEEESKLVHDEL